VTCSELIHLRIRKFLSYLWN